MNIMNIWESWHKRQRLKNEIPKFYLIEVNVFTIKFVLLNYTIWNVIINLIKTNFIVKALPCIIKCDNV